MYHQLYIQRRERRLSQKDLAKLLKIHQASYQNKEIGRTAFTLPEAILLADYFEMTLDELFNPKKTEETLDVKQKETGPENPKHEVPPEVLASMWQFFLKTSVPRLIAEYELKKETEDAKTER